MFRTTFWTAAYMLGLSMPLAVAPSFADESTTTKSTILDAIVITANKREQSVLDVQASVEVISQQELQRYSGTTVIETLRDAAGVDARSSGANSSVTMRGQIPGAGTSVLILVDGIPRTAKYGIDNLNLIGMENVERIEVVRGPMSALYGANAAGGVINIITRGPEGSGGSISTTVGAAMSKAGDGRETFNSNATMYHSAGETAHRLTLGTRQSKPFAFDNETDDALNGINHMSLAYHGSWHITDADSLDLRLEGYKQDDRSAGETRTGVSFTKREEEQRLFGSLSYTGDVGPGLASLTGSHSAADGSANRAIEIESTTYTQSILQGQYVIDSEELGFEGHTFLTGAGFSREEIEIDILSRVGERDTSHAYIQDEWIPLDFLSVIGGLRVDKFSDFGTHAVPRITIGSRGDGLTWRVGYGEAFRAPSVIEQHSEFTRGRSLIRGNQALKPEESVSYEAAIGWRGDRAQIEAVYHHSNIDNLIETVRTGAVVGGLAVIEYQNVDKALIRGVELVGDALVTPAITLSGSYAWLDAKDDNGSRLQQRARHTVKISATYEQGPWSATLRGRSAIGYFAADPNLRGSAAFDTRHTTVDVNASYQLREDLKLIAGIDNIQDQQVPVNYASNGTIEDPAGRFAYATVKLDF